MPLLISDLRCLSVLVISRHGTLPPVRNTWGLFSNLAYLRSELERDPATLRIQAKVAEATVVGRSVEIAAVQNQAGHGMSAIRPIENPREPIYISFGALCEFEQRAAALLIALPPFFYAVRGAAAVFCHAVDVSG